MTLIVFLCQANIRNGFVGRLSLKSSESLFSLWPLQHKGVRIPSRAAGSFSILPRDLAGAGVA